MTNSMGNGGNEPMGTSRKNCRVAEPPGVAGISIPGQTDGWFCVETLGLGLAHLWCMKEPSERRKRILALHARAIRFRYRH